MAYQLVDQYGQPLRKEVLTAELATPTLAGVRSIWAEHPSSGLTPLQLGEILVESERGDATRYLELAEDMEEKDLHYRSVLGTRKLACAQLQITVEPGGSAKEELKAAELVNDVLQRDALQAELVDVLDGIGKGYSVVEIMWELSERQWMPVRLEHRDPRWFAFDVRDGRTLRLKGPPGADDAMPSDAGSDLQPMTMALPSFKFIVHTPKSKSGLPIRSGLARAAAWAYLFKNWNVKDWMGFVETYGQPFRIGKYDGNATADDKKVLLRAVRSISSDAAAIIPRSMEIEFLKGIERGAGGEVFLMLANFMDQQVSKAVLGQTTTTDAISGGHAVSKEHNEVRGDLMLSDGAQLGATLNRDLIRPLIDLNIGPQKRYPRVRLGMAEIVDADAFTLGLERFVRLGGKVSQRFARAKLGFEEPEEGDELLGPPTASMPGKVGSDETASADGGVAEEEGAEEEGAEEEGDEAAHSVGQDGGDAIDGLLGDLFGGGGWRELVAPVIDPVTAAIEGSATPEELRARLAALIADMDTTRLQEALARTGFNAQVAGSVGAPLTADPAF